MSELDLDGTAVIEALDHPVLLVDGGTVLAHNDAFRALAGVEESDTGPLSAVLADHPALRSRIEDGEEGTARLETGEGPRFFDLSVSRLEGDGDVVGDLWLLHDVTERQREHRDLERRNEHLDEFASLISHDLRNPLDVAIGRATVLRERTEDPELTDHFDELDAAHERMRRLIQDVLTLARQGRSIDDTSRVSLNETAQTAWRHVDTAGAALHVETDRSVCADRERLERVFENLFRNSVEHCVTDGCTLRVTVSELADGDGFYVADDGPGIPESERGDVFEAGYSGDDGNTGLGLAIVHRIAKAHGWAVTVTDSDADGARFEFTGVDLLSDDCRAPCR
jgi:signal transduction histidine kinase